MTGHTKGPWGWLECGGTLRLVGLYGPRPCVLTTLYVSHGEDYDPPGYEVLAVGVDTPRRLVPLTPVHPDARLMAASPDLLEALAGIVEIGKRDLSNPKYDGYFRMAREAINKARGVTS